MFSFLFGVIFITALSASRADMMVETLCTNGAVSIVNKEYFAVLNNTCFMFVTKDSVRYEFALRICQLHNGTLAMPKTRDVNEYLLQEMGRLGQREPMWIGMHDKVKEGEYVWEDGTKVQAWGNMDWANSKVVNGGEDCIALNPMDRKWHDYGCSISGFLSNRNFFGNEKLPFICQYPIKIKAPNNDEMNQETRHDQDVDRARTETVDDTQDQGDKIGTGSEEDSFDDEQRQGDEIDEDYGQEDKVEEDDCEPFNCPDLDCGMNGYKYENGCQKCECQAGDW